MRWIIASFRLSLLFFVVFLLLLLYCSVSIGSFRVRFGACKTASVYRLQYALIVNMQGLLLSVLLFCTLS